jgi:hypothetical protein
MHALGFDPTGGNRFSDKIMRQSMIPKSGNRFSDKIMLNSVETPLHT